MKVYYLECATLCYHGNHLMCLGLYDGVDPECFVKSHTCIYTLFENFNHFTFTLHLRTYDYILMHTFQIFVWLLHQQIF